ncbi:MAG: MaoC family dehydratase N-terminal domain-containing protein, partial [Sphingopyxis sp.]
MAFAPWIGRTRTQHDEVTDGLIARLCATIDTARPPASHAPQGAHWCLCLPDAPTAALGVDGHPVAENGADAFMPPIPLPRRMWAGSAVQFHAPIAGGAAIERQSTIHAVADKTGTTGPLIFVTVDHAIWADGILAVQERQNIVYRDAATTPATFATPRAGHATLNHADWPDQRRIAPHEAQLARYSAITFNAHRIHYDRPYAVEQEGYAGLVVHGPLTATLLLD